MTTFEARLDAVLPLPDPAEHRFKGVERAAEGGYYGRCSCGHVETPASDKDTAYAEIVTHYEPMVRRVLLREAVRRNPALLDDLEGGAALVDQLCSRTEARP